MKNLITTIGLSTVLFIATSAQADISEENYNPHANNHMGYAEAHSGKTQEMPTAYMKKMTSKKMNNTINGNSLSDATEDPFSLDYSHDH